MNRRNFVLSLLAAFVGKPIHSDASALPAQPIAADYWRWQAILEYSAVAFGPRAASPYPPNPLIRQAFYRHVSSPIGDWAHVEGYIDLVALDSWVFDLVPDAEDAWETLTADMLLAYEDWARETQPFTMRMGRPRDADEYTDLGEESIVFSGWKGNELDVGFNSAMIMIRQQTIVQVMACWAFYSPIDDPHEDEPHQYLYALAERTLEQWSNGDSLEVLLPAPVTLAGTLQVDAPVDVTLAFQHAVPVATPAPPPAPPPVVTYFGTGAPRWRAIPEFTKIGFGPSADPNRYTLPEDYPDAPVITHALYATAIEPADGPVNLTQDTLLEMDIWVLDLAPKTSLNVVDISDDLTYAYNRWSYQTQDFWMDLGKSGRQNLEPLGDGFALFRGTGGRSLWSAALAVQKGTRIQVLVGWSGYIDCDDILLDIASKGIDRWGAEGPPESAIPSADDLQPGMHLSGPIDASAPFLDPAHNPG